MTVHAGYRDPTVNRLEDTLHTVQAWKDLLQNTVEDSLPAALSLEQESPILHVREHPAS